MMRAKFPYLFLLLAVLVSNAAHGQTCSSGSDLDAQVRTSLHTTGRSVYHYIQKGDIFSIKSNTIDSLANSPGFNDIQQAITDTKSNFVGEPTLKGAWLLDASSQTGTIQRAEFYCGIFNSPDRVGFILNNLPAGKYALVVEQGGGASPMVMSVVLQVVNHSFKIAGLYLRPTSVNGHDGQYYLQQAKQLNSQGNKDVAFLNYGLARELIAPVDFETNTELEKLDDEADAVSPPNLPVNGPVNLTGPDGKSYQVTSVRPQVTTKDGLRLLVRQSVPDATNTGASTVANFGLAKAAITKWPQLRDNFQSMLLIAADQQGRTYGTILKITDIK